MKKGITPVIAIIVLLLITVALAGMAWNYLQAYWTHILGKNMQVMDSYCIAGNEGVIILRNTGTKEINVIPGVGDVTVINTSSGSDPGGTWYNINTPTAVTEVEPGQVVRYNVTCSDLCLFRFLVGGRSATASVQC
jgi:flagellin-like protein